MNNQNNRISSLDGLKVIMLISLFCWHTPTNPNWPIGEPLLDIGARMCEVLFVVSGFLVGYMHYNKLIPATLKDSFNYAFNKFIKIWPIHLIAFIIIFIHLINTKQLVFDMKTLFSAIINLSLLQSWTNDPFSFNGVTWFISSLLFCYFMSPLLMKILKKSSYLVIVTFISCIFIRIILELVYINGFNLFYIDFHTSPIIRCLEFFIAMMMLPAYQKIKNIILNNNSTLLMSFIEIIITIIYIYLAIHMQDKWIRGYFVITACLLVFVYALNEGILSKILSTKIFTLFASIQMEFYIFHQVIIRSLDPILSIFINSVLIESIILFCIILIISFMYNRLFKKKCNLIMERLLMIK